MVGELGEGEETELNAKMARVKRIRGLWRQLALAVGDVREDAVRQSVDIVDGADEIPWPTLPGTYRFSSSRSQPSPLSLGQTA